MKNKWISFLKLNVFTFGEQKVSQFVLFECKYLFSIIFFYFHPTKGVQDRYHTHAFNAFSIKLWGEYTELILRTLPYSKWGEALLFSTRRRTEVFRYFPKDCFHAIGESNGCATILFSGPWDQSWEEYKEGKFTTYTWGREKQ